MTFPQQAGASKDQASAIDHQYMDKTVAYLVQNQGRQLESYLPVLATTGNITPFIGLLGTVLGIIDSFREIGCKERPVLQQWPRRVGGVSGDGCRIVYRHSGRYLLQLLSDAYS